MSSVSTTTRAVVRTRTTQAKALAERVAARLCDVDVVDVLTHVMLMLVVLMS